uniref:RELT like 1 n=1 Tax=Equus asinus TaxID=9793 RepID=A0A8C4LJ87_EQUAS
MVAVARCTPEQRRHRRPLMVLGTDTQNISRMRWSPCSSSWVSLASSFATCLRRKAIVVQQKPEQDVEEEKVEKIANVDVLKALVADNTVNDPESPVTPSTPGSPPLSPGPLSPGATPGKHICGHHLHTVGGAVERDVCHRCRHKRWHFIKPTNKSREGRPRRQGEVTVLSVGRFRVTKVEHKSNQKERRSLMSVNGNEGVNGEVPVTPVKREQSDTEKQE